MCGSQPHTTSTLISSLLYFASRWRVRWLIHSVMSITLPKQIWTRFILIPSSTLQHEIRTKGQLALYYASLFERQSRSTFLHVSKVFIYSFHMSISVSNFYFQAAYLILQCHLTDNVQPFHFHLIRFILPYFVFQTLAFEAQFFNSCVEKDLFD
ncbi:hypothetical protein FF1_019077 [Malus domestica]